MPTTYNKTDKQDERVNSLGRIQHNKIATPAPPIASICSFLREYRATRGRSMQRLRRLQKRFIKYREGIVQSENGGDINLSDMTF